MKALEVFDLPVASGEKAYNSDDIFQANGSGLWCATFCSDEQAKCAAKCINNADALADALESILPYIDSHQWLGVVGEKAQHDAILALKAYRGAE